MKVTFIIDNSSLLEKKKKRDSKTNGVDVMDYCDGIYPISKNILIFEISECLATISRAQHPIYHRQLATHVIYYFK